MSTRRTRTERNALRDLGWKLSLDKYRPPDLDLIDLKVPDNTGQVMILEPHSGSTAYLTSNLSRDIENCR